MFDNYDNIFFILPGHFPKDPKVLFSFFTLKRIGLFGPSCFTILFAKWSKIAVLDHFAKAVVRQDG